MSTVQFYADSGFDSKYAFLPVLFYKDTSKPMLIYTHYPGLPDITATIISQLFETTSSRKLMLLPIALSMLLFFIIYKVMNELIINDIAAFIGASFLVTSNYLFCWADDLHQHVYVEVVRWLFVWMAFQLFNKSHFDYPQFACLYVLYFIAIWISFEPVVYLAIVTVGFSWVFKRKLISWPVVVLLTAPVLGFGLHMLQNYVFLGSWEKVYSDMITSAIHRTTGDVGYNELGRPVTFKEIPFAIQILLLRVGKFYWVNGISMLLLLFYVLKQTNKTETKLLITLMVAAVSWHIVMPQHAIIHMFTLRHYAIPFAMIIGIGLIAYRQLLFDLYKSGSWALYVFHLPIILLTVAYGCYEQIYLAVLTYSIYYPAWGKDLKFLFWI